jgi:hypothetical protein
LAIVVNDLEPRRTHPLYSTLLADATFHELLLVFDQDIAIAARRGRCPLCSSVLHSAQYRRKPRGRPAGLGEEHDWRFSFCCARDDCRTRRTPPSLRFLGRKVYLAAIVVLIAILREGATAARMRQLSELIGVNKVQTSLIERNAGVPPERAIEFRVGIHVGDVVEESDGDLMGDGVNIAARLEGVATPGAICLSEDAYRQVKSRLDLKISDLGPVRLKNIAEPIRERPNADDLPLL